MRSLSSHIEQIRRELTSTVEVFNQRFEDLTKGRIAHTETRSAFEMLEARISWLAQIEVLSNEQLPRLDEVKTVDHLKQLGALALEEAVKHKREEEAHTSLFTSKVSLKVIQGTSLEDVATFLTTHRASYVCWNQLRIQINDALKELEDSPATSN